MNQGTTPTGPGSGGKIPDHLRQALTIEGAKRGCKTIAQARNVLVEEFLTELGYVFVKPKEVDTDEVR